MMNKGNKKRRKRRQKKTHLFLVMVVNESGAEPRLLALKSRKK